MWARILSIVFVALMGAASLCVVVAALVAIFALPGAAFPPKDTSVVLLVLAAALAGAGLGLTKLLTGSWVPFAKPDQEEFDPFYQEPDEAEDEEEQPDDGSRQERASRTEDRLLPF
jgi:hypothetical protein